MSPRIVAIVGLADVVSQQVLSETEVMKINSQSSPFLTSALLALFAFVAVSSTGCTVYHAGMTLPNPHYLNNRPQYFQKGTEFPFPNEAANLQAVERDRH